MKLNKLIVLALTCAMCFPYIYVQANGENYAALFEISQEQTTEGRLLNIRIRGLNTNDAVDALLVLPKQVDRIDVLADHMISGNEMVQAIHADENDEKEAGKLYRFYMPDDAPYGVYTILAGGATPAGKLLNRYHKFYYGNSVEASKTFVSTTVLTAANLEAGMKKGYFYIDTGNPAYLANKDVVAKIVDELNPQDQFALEEAFRMACDFVDAKSMDAYKLDAYMTIRSDRLGFAENNADYVRYPENTKRIFKEILDQASGHKVITDLEDLRHTFIEACAVSAIDKETDAFKVIDKLKEYNENVFHLDFNSEAYKKVYPYDVGKQFVDHSYSSVAKIVDDFNSRVAYLAENAGNNSRPSGGGGFGSGGMTVSAPVDVDQFNELTGNTPVFFDVPRSHWANSYIEFCYKNSIMNGDGDGGFRPDEHITRSEFVKTILNAFGIDPVDAQSGFSDVSDRDWAYPYISKAYVMGVTNGISETEFGPGMIITRQDAVTMLFRLVSMERVDYPFKSEVTLEFTDKEAIADYADRPIKSLAGENVVSGYEDGSFMPESSITRAETAKIIKALLDTVG